MTQTDIPSIGPYQGAFNPALTQAEALQDIPALLAQAECISDGADKLFRYQNWAIKVFKRQSWLKDQHDLKNSSKAERSWHAAQHLMAHNIGTPAPIAFLDRWQNQRLVESYFITEYVADMSCFRDELAQLYWHEPDNEKLLGLLQPIADAVRAMHDAGLMHGDMGNQNIILQRVDSHTWGNVQFVDLNRVRIAPALTAQDKAFDLSRISLVSDYLRVFKLMYSQGPVDPELDKIEQRLRQRFAWHSKTRPLRHPIKQLKRKWHPETEPPTYPPEQDIWIWDERSAQAMVTLSRRDRKRYRSTLDVLHAAWTTLLAAPSIWRRYQKNLNTAFTKPTELQHRFAIALNAAGDLTQELAAHQALGNPPVLIRIEYHRGYKAWQHGVELIQHLHQQGVLVSVALVQNRQAVLQPSQWHDFLQQVIPAIHNKVLYVEVGHATNRVKWGIWRYREYRTLLAATRPLQKRYPDLRWTGPAGIDFEYPRILPWLKHTAGFRFQALSHHLYVDRRGAPENKQGQFALVEKCALLKAMAQWANIDKERVILSEANWPLKGTNVWSPIGSPYQTPGTHPDDEPGVSEALYAQYMIRYITLALCSGMVEQVYWWRLAAKGYGLLDDQTMPWHTRPAFTALQTWLATMGKGFFTKRLASPENCYALQYKHEQETWIIAWCTEEEQTLTLPQPWLSGVDLYGTPLINQTNSDKLTLLQNPTYYRLA